MLKMGFARLFSSYVSASIRLQRPIRPIRGGFPSIGNRGLCASWSTEGATSDSSDGEYDDEGSSSKAAEIKHQILAAALSHVPEQGWSHRAIAAGAESVCYPGASHGMFPRGGIELVNYFSIDCNERLARELSSIPPPKASRIRGYESFLQNALEMRLRMILPHIDTWTQALALMALPANVPDATRNLRDLVDDVWYYAGDRTPDFSWYTRRAGLAAVYVSTQLALIQDRSEDHADTWSFLNRRIKQLEAANEGITQKQAFADGLPVFLESAAITLKNVLGLRIVLRDRMLP